MDFPLVPVVHDEGQHVGCSNFSILGGRSSSIFLTGTTVSAGVLRRCHTQLSEEKHSDLDAECVPGPGAITFYLQAAFIRGSMIPLGERTPPSPVTGRGERDSGVITWIPSIGWWYCCSLPLVDIGSCLPLTMKGQDHSCFSQAISSGTAR